MLKKVIKFSIEILVLLVLIWETIFIINFFRCVNYKPPIFYLSTLSHEYSCIYKCLGYSIVTDIESSIKDWDRNDIVKSEFFWKNTKLFETDLLK